MKRLLLCSGGLFIGFFSTSAFADLLIYEPFDYTPSTAIIGQVNNYSMNSPITWNQAGTAGSPVHSVLGGSLTAPAGFPASIGNSADMVKSDITEFGRLDLPSSYYTDTVLYYSLLLNVPSTSGLNTPNSNVNANNDMMIAFNNTTGAGARPSNWGGELVIRQGSLANTYNLGIRASGTTAGTTYWTPDLNPGDTHLVVVRYAQGSDASIGTDDSNDIWIDPSSATFGAAIAPGPDGSSQGSINQGSPANNHADSLIIGAGISNTGTVSNPDHTYFDEIRVGTTWADVTAVPEPSSVLLAGLGLGALGLVSWYRTRRR